MNLFDEMEIIHAFIANSAQELRDKVREGRREGEEGKKDCVFRDVGFLGRY